MIVTRDYDLIRSIIEQPDILPGFNNGNKPTKDQLESDSMVYFYEPGVGLFPANLISDKALVFHAAIPKESRGIKAIRAAKSLGVELLANGFTIYTQQVNKPHFKRFVLLIGFEFLFIKKHLHYYQLRAVR